MNRGTIIRTIARVAFSVYSAFCVWQIAITELSEQLKAPWLVGLCAIVIVVAGLITDICTTWYNNDYTKVAAQHTAEMRQHKKELEDGYIGDRFFTEEEEPDDEEVEDEQEDIQTV